MADKNIIIVDYGMGNLRSVQKAFERIKIPAIISAEKNVILTANRLILPGVGHFEKGIANLKDRGLFNVLNEAVIGRRIPILGICLGMQLMTEFSEEGNIEGFGWISARTNRFLSEIIANKIPHMGWNNISRKKDSPLFQGIATDQLFYFVHSFYIHCNDERDILAETAYGQKFVSAFNKENIYGCQFHPEKSHDAGLQMLNNYSLIDY